MENYAHSTTPDYNTNTNTKVNGGGPNKKKEIRAMRKIFYIDSVDIAMINIHDENTGIDNVDDDDDKYNTQLTHIVSTLVQRTSM